MYRGFNLTIKDFGNTELYLLGNELKEMNINKIDQELSQYTDEKGMIVASRLTAKWFPQIKADIFLSHSHNDEKIAITLAGWLKKNFQLNAFVDSCIWGYADKLLRAIDKDFCYNKEKKTYSYSQRNKSTSHVHMMLSIALANMIDNTECIFFLNTPNSITPSDVLSATLSPWLYSEIAMSKLIRKKDISDHRLNKSRKLLEIFSKTAQLKVKYDVNLDHLEPIDNLILQKWKEQYTKNSSYNALDDLYLILQ